LVELDLHLSKILSLKSDQHQSKSDQRFVELDRRLIIFLFIVDHTGKTNKKLFFLNKYFLVRNNEGKKVTVLKK